MDTIYDLEDLFLHYIQKLFAAEKQIAEAMPAIIEKARHQSLKNALLHHLNISKKHSSRLHKIMKEHNNAIGEEEDETALKTDIVSKGTLGLIEATHDLLSRKIDKDVNDAAIIGCVQQIEHYEICAYGTALAYAAELGLYKAAELLRETLDEEYDADDLLTALATAALNKEGIPEDWEEDKKSPAADTDARAGSDSHSVSITERTINSPGGRAGTSHRRYPSGESRGH